jgi:hypothetical protein
MAGETEEWLARRRRNLTLSIVALQQHLVRVKDEEWTKVEVEAAWKVHAFFILHKRWRWGPPL